MAMLNNQRVNIQWDNIYMEYLYGISMEMFLHLTQKLCWAARCRTRDIAICSWQSKSFWWHGNSMWYSIDIPWKDILHIYIYYIYIYIYDIYIYIKIISYYISWFRMWNFLRFALVIPILLFVLVHFPGSMWWRFLKRPRYQQRWQLEITEYFAK